MAYAEQAFTESLGGHGLVGNNSRWLRFPTIRNERWWNGGNVVLLGDAAHTAHFSVGSGTKMAMEDAAALAAALAEAVDVAGAATEYERNRRPAVDRVQRAAEPSRAWWESFGGWVSADLSTFAVNFLTRSGRELVGDLRARDPRFARAHTRGTALDEKVVLGDGLQLARRVAVVADDEAGEDPSRLRDLAAGAAAHGASLVVVPSTAVDAVGAAWPDLVDAVHRWGALVGIDRAGPGVPSDRCDLVLFAGDEPVPTDRPSIGVLIAPRGAADHDAHDRLVDVARRRRAEGVVAVGLQPAADDDDARIGLITACQRIRPAIDLPLLVWGCRSDDDAATFVHAGRADVCVGRPTFGSRWRS
jgi:anthraniloyl-CoA monooxygenase